MYERLLTFLRCPYCGARLQAQPFASVGLKGEMEISEGLLRCEQRHWFPIVRGIPRMLKGGLARFWKDLDEFIPQSAKRDIQREHFAGLDGADPARFDRRTFESFGLEWQKYRLGARTWGMDLQDRVKWYFTEPLKFAPEKLEGRVVLDAGCGNGTQSVAYNQLLGVEVIALDISSGLEHGHAFRCAMPGARADRVHFVQADLQCPPLSRESVDIIHSAGVLHHTPDTRVTFKILCNLLRPGGSFYAWLYKYEPWVTPTLRAIRRVTTQIPSPVFDSICRAMAPPFVAFRALMNATGVRSYPSTNSADAALALMDIFGAPYAHCHSFEEVSAWFRGEGFETIWPCNNGRRGFGVCGRLPMSKQQVIEVAEATRSVAGV